MRVRVGGRVFEVCREDVFKAVRGVKPEPLSGRRKYYVEIDGRRYPIKQVVGLLLGLPRVAFTAMEAYRVLTRLGFEVKSREDVKVSGEVLAGELVEWIFDELSRVFSSHDGLEVFVVHRAKFEGWVKVELARVLGRRFRDVVPEVDNIDLVADGWAIEIKTVNTNYSFPGVLVKHRPITKNIMDVVGDIRKLKAKAGYRCRAVFFVVFPLPDRVMNQWRIHLSKISRELKHMYSRKFKFKNGVPGVMYLGLI